MISKKLFLFALIALLGTVCAQRAAAQAANVPVGKIAVIFSEAFQDSKQGITKFAVIQNQLNTEFKKPQEDLDAAAKQVQALQDEIARLQKSVAPADPKAIQAKMDQLDQLKKDSQRKLEDTQALYQKRRTDLLGPLQDEVGKALVKELRSLGSEAEFINADVRKEDDVRALIDKTVARFGRDRKSVV